MHDHLILFIAGFLGTLALILGYVVWAVRVEARADQDHYEAQRRPGEGDVFGGRP